MAVARIIIEINHVVNIYAPGQTAEHDMLSVYYTQDRGEQRALRAQRRPHRHAGLVLRLDLNDRHVKEVDDRVRSLAPRRERTIDPDLIPLGNGVFDYRTKQLMPFSPEYVITGKAAID